mmetsp:Transcript_72521/g.216380  ORF Transcript_72521/g.216380 Transcript_72521/m.216380 type:complete len:424 (+) Transcript_72521:2184-3455(+)
MVDLQSVRIRQLCLGELHVHGDYMLRCRTRGADLPHLLQDLQHLVQGVGGLAEGLRHVRRPAADPVEEAGHFCEQPHVVGPHVLLLALEIHNVSEHLDDPPLVHMDLIPVLDQCPQGVGAVAERRHIPPPLLLVARVVWPLRLVERLELHRLEERLQHVSHGILYEHGQDVVIFSAGEPDEDLSDNVPCFLNLIQHDAEEVQHRRAAQGLHEFIVLRQLAYGLGSLELDGLVLLGLLLVLRSLPVLILLLLLLVWKGGHEQIRDEVHLRKHSPRLVQVEECARDLDPLPPPLRRVLPLQGVLHRPQDHLLLAQEIVIFRVPLLASLLDAAPELGELVKIVCVEGFLDHPGELVRLRGGGRRIQLRSLGPHVAGGQLRQVQERDPCLSPLVKRPGRLSAGPPSATPTLGAESYWRRRLGGSGQT